MKLDLRVEGNLKYFLERMAREAGSSVSDVAEELAWIGIDVERSGGYWIEGPLGFMRRPLARISMGGGRERLTLWVDKELVEELKRVFGKSPGTAMIEALRLGTLALKPEATRITGPFGVKRPLASARTPPLKSERAIKAAERLKEALKNFEKQRNP